MSAIPITGAFVYDRYDGQTKFCPGFDFRTNPGGYHNGTFANSRAFVFTPLAEQGTSASSDGTTVGEEALLRVPGAALAFTPERLIQSLWHYCQTDVATGYAGQHAQLDTDRVTWGFPTFGANSSSTGPMQHKMGDVNLTGKSILYALKIALDAAGEYGTGRGRMRLPVRVQVTDKVASDSTGVYHDVAYNNGLRITEDGLVWFDGMTDDVGAPADWIYCSTTSATITLKDVAAVTTSHATYPHLRKIKINAAIVHDARITGIKDMFKGTATIDTDPNNIRRELDEGMASTAQGPRLLHYVLDPGGYRIEHQVKSQPAPDKTIVTATASASGGTSTGLLSIPAAGLSRELHTDQAQIDDAALRQLRKVAKAKKRHTCKLPGVYHPLRVGGYVENFTLQPSGSYYQVGAPVVRQIVDYEKQNCTMEMDG